MKQSNLKYIAKLLYNDGNLNNSIFDKYINDINFINLILKVNYNSILSLFLKYYMNIKDDEKINMIFDYPNIKLMKRDIFELIKYYYVFNNTKSIYLFIDIFINDNNIINNNIIETKDLNFIINNQLYKLLIYLNDFYITTTLSNDLNKINNSNIIYKFINKDDLLINNLLKYFESKISADELKNINEIFTNINYDIILDGGNIIHSTNGIINDINSCDNIKIIINRLKINNFKNPLLIIHKKHIKNFKNILNYLELNKINYYLSPYNYYDDIFILWFFIKSNLSSYVISNDQFSDHLSEIIKINYNNNKLNNLKYIIKEKILNYNIKNKYINEIPKYSKCIQCDNTYIYIPTKTDDFIIFDKKMI
jgi:hypothetical protein